ncbi:AMP-binding protein [Peribacillus frigoritolerans]|nr:AMP-binding protein [Peribacillus frigoritolerans]
MFRLSVIFVFLIRNGSIPGWSESWSVLESGSVDEVKVDNIKLNDPVMLMYTSGTTGRPKGAIWTHDTTFWFSTIQALKWKFTGIEVAMTTGPLYHVGAMEDIALPDSYDGWKRNNYKKPRIRDWENSFRY